MRIALNGVRAVFHRPHHQKETNKGAVKSMRRLLTEAGSHAMMEYKGSVGKVEFDEDAGIIHGEVINTRDVITFQGDSVAEVKKGRSGAIQRLRQLTYTRCLDKPVARNSQHTKAQYVATCEFVEGGSVLSVEFQSYTSEENLATNCRFQRIIRRKYRNSLSQLTFSSRFRRIFH